MSTTRTDRIATKPHEQEAKFIQDVDPAETREWLESLDDVLYRHGPDRAIYLLSLLNQRAARSGVTVPYSANTPYINTIPAERQPTFPGSREIERRIKSIIRWNAMAMVVRANREEHGVGGHISTYASAATLLEIGFNHFFHGKDGDFHGDIIYFQGHASPGIYARAYLEGRLSAEHLQNFRREIKSHHHGLASYPHPWLMPDFWEYPTVSMGLGPIQAIYQARFMNYLRDRNLNEEAGRVWCFLGDGEMDEPESLGAITLASREKLDNLIFVVNCNLQRLDGPVRGNGKIIQELEAAFKGAGWNVIKLIWGGEWDALLAKDETGLLVSRMNELVDGELQKLSIISRCLHPRELLRQIPRTAQDGRTPLRRTARQDAHAAATTPKRSTPPTRPPSNIPAAPPSSSHAPSRATDSARRAKDETSPTSRRNSTRTNSANSAPASASPSPTGKLPETPFFRPPDDSPEVQYIQARRKELGGYVPSRKVRVDPIQTPPLSEFDEYLKGSNGREASTTMAFVRMFGRLLRDETIGKLIVPIVPDEARTFGLEALFRAAGIYSHAGQLYEPVDSQSLLYYRESRDGQILEEGITEAGSMASFIAAGTAYASHGVNTIPFFLYYSMFGFQRIGDLIWAAADSRAKGFMLGCTAGRTTLAGEGLQHQDGHSHLVATTIPNLLTYDPAYAYEIAVITQDGIKRMYQDQEDVFYYMTLYNENYAMPAMPENCAEGILKGMYRFSSRDAGKDAPRVQLFGSGPILNEALRAQDILAEKYDVASDVWSLTSYKQLPHRRHGRPPLEPPASGKRTTQKLSRTVSGRRARSDHRRHRLCHPCARPDPPLDPR